MPNDIKYILLGVIITVVAYEVIGLRKWVWSWNKQRLKNRREQNEERKRFHQDINRLVYDSQNLRPNRGVHTTSQFPQSKINRFRNDLIRTSPYIKPSALKIVQEMIAWAEEMIRQGIVGDEFVDYLERQCRKVNRKNRITPPRR